VHIGHVGFAYDVALANIVSVNFQRNINLPCIFYITIILLDYQIYNGMISTVDNIEKRAI
jgi:hypothetical protein